MTQKQTSCTFCCVRIRGIWCAKLARMRNEIVPGDALAAQMSEMLTSRDKATATTVLMAAAHSKRSGVFALILQATMKAFDEEKDEVRQSIGGIHEDCASEYC